MQTYLFYDIESSGLNKAFDQVLHFAAIRTDRQLQELERYDIKVKLNPDTIPAPRATITHHIGITDTETGVSEYQAIQHIHSLLNAHGTISLGYNTLGFDDEFLRFSFYRNLLPPYTHQFANQCGRMDLYPITLMYYLFNNDVLCWPLHEGKPSLKLEKINAVNQFIEGRSHHAMVDVEVTLALARRLIKARDMWDYITHYFAKNIDQERALQLPLALEHRGQRLQEGLMLNGKWGTNDHYQAPVLYLGTSLPYKNQSLWLRLDTEDLQKTTPATIAETTWVVRKKWGEPGLILPLKARFLAHLKPERQALARENKAWLTANPGLLQDIIDYHRHYIYPEIPAVDIEASLYLNRFWSEAEQVFCRRFHAARPDDKVLLIDKTNNPHLKSLALRLLGRHYPEYLSASQYAVYADYLKRLKTPTATDAIIDFKGRRRLCPNTALADIEVLRKESLLDPTQMRLLDELEIYICNRFC